MRTLKLVIWDLDQTILHGILEEGDEQVNPIAEQAMFRLMERGILQALATVNQHRIISNALNKFNWSQRFVQVAADVGPKVYKVRHILETLAVDPLDAVFIDADAFERDSIRVQVPGLSAWSVAELAAYLTEQPLTMTPEGRRRPQVYLEQQKRDRAETTAADYAEFLRACHIQLTIRPYRAEDAARVEELLTRTHQMNLGILQVGEAIARLNQPGPHRVMIAELKDRYGDMGRCGVIHLTPMANHAAYIESLAISCRTRARGLSLSMLAGLLKHPRARFAVYHCGYVSNGFNRPLRMLLMAARFKPQPDQRTLLLTQERLTAINLPDWLETRYQTNENGDKIDDCTKSSD